MFRDLRRSIFGRPFEGLNENHERALPAVSCWAIFVSLANRTILQTLGVIFLLGFVLSTARAQVGDYEGRAVSAVDGVLEGAPADPTAQGEFKSLLKISAGGE